MYRHKIADRIWVTVAVLLLAGLGLIGCESAKDSSGGGSLSVSISVSRASLSAGESSLVEATVTNGGTPVGGAEVQFDATPDGSGMFTQTSVVTDSEGKAATMFSPSEYGYINITASASTDGSVATRQITLTVTQDAQAGTGNISLTAASSLLTANGSDQTTITIAVRDGGGNPAPDGTIVRMTAGERFVDRDGNGYWTAGIDSLLTDYNNNGQWDAIGMIPSSATVSGGSGLAQVAYTAGSQAGTVFLRATVTDDTYAGYDEFSLQLAPDADVHSIFLFSDSVSLSVQATGGMETSWLRARCFDVWGNTVPEGIVVTFSILDSPGGGEYLGTVEGATTATAVTNSQGVASTVIHSGTTSGTVRTRAYVEGVLSNATQVLISAGPPYEIVVGIEECNVPWWNIVGEELEVVAVVSDIYNNPVNDSTVVYFTCDEGIVKSHQNRTMNQNGKAFTTWISGTNFNEDDGRVIVWAETAGGTVRDSTIFFNSFIPDTLVVTGVPTTIVADGATEVNIRISGFDFNWNPLVNNTKVNGEAALLKVDGTSLEDGCFSSSGRAKITSVSLDVDYSCSYPAVDVDDGIGAVDIVEFWSGLASSYFEITILTGTSYAGNSQLTAQATTVGPAETVVFDALIKDRFGNPLGDHTLTMTATGGSVDPTTAVQHTNRYGEASGFEWRAPAAPGKYTVMVTDGDPRGQITLSTTITVEDAE
jgi:hypothetical protein